MLIRLPPETIAQIIERLPREDGRSVALVCSALRPYGHRLLFRVIQISVEKDSIIPHDAELVLSYPHLLQYVSTLLVQGRIPLRSREPRGIPAIPVHYLWSHLATMRRLDSIHLGFDFTPSNYGGVLSALEGLNSAREITLRFTHSLQTDIFLSEHSLPIDSLTLPLDQSGHRLGNQLLHKCSTSLVELILEFSGTSIPDFPFLPHLQIFSLQLADLVNEEDLTPWFPFFDQHPSLTCLTLDGMFTSVALPHRNLLPNLQSLTARPSIIERLIPGRPVHEVLPQPFAFETSPTNLFQSFLLSSVPVTNLDFGTHETLSTDTLIEIIRSVPMLRELTLETEYEVCDWLKGECRHIDFKQFPFVVEGILHALGRCKYIQHVGLSFRDLALDTRDQNRPFWSRADIVDMIAVIQETGADDLWSLRIQGDHGKQSEAWFAARVGWLDVASQPKLKGEWNIRESLRNSNVE